MNTEPPQLVAHEATTRGVLAFLDFKDVEAFAVLCSFRATDGELEDATWNPTAWWRSALEMWIDNSSREYDRAVWTDRIEQKFFGGATIDGRGPRDYSGAPTNTRLRSTGTDRFDRTDGEQTPHYWDLKKVVSDHAGYPPERDGLSPVANYDVELAFGSHDAGGRYVRLATSAVSFIQREAPTIDLCSIKGVIDGFDLDVCAVGMHVRGGGIVDYVVAPEDAEAIESKTMRLRTYIPVTRVESRIEKYRRRGYTFIEP